MLAERLKQLGEELAPFDDPQERLAFIVDRAKRLPPLPPAERTEANRVHGCISVVWLVGEVRDGLCVFRGDADSPVVRGLLALLCEFFGQTSPTEIAATAADPLKTLGVLPTLSPTRRHGLASARTRILEIARNFL